MVIGLGIDLVYLSEFRAQLGEVGSAFASVTFTAEEAAYSRSRASRDPVRHLAARFAAKEATLKALDQACATRGVQPDRVPMTDIEVVCDAAGRPWLRLHGAAQQLAEELEADRVLVTLSHDGPCATAAVVLERLA